MFELAAVEFAAVPDDDRHDGLPACGSSTSKPAPTSIGVEVSSSIPVSDMSRTVTASPSAPRPSRITRLSGAAALTFLRQIVEMRESRHERVSCPEGSATQWLTSGKREVQDRPSRCLSSDDFPIIVAAEGKERIQRGEGASAERALEARRARRSAARISAASNVGVAGRFLHHRFLGFGDEPRLELPIAADALGGFRTEALGKRGDPAARAGRPASGPRAAPRAARGVRRVRRRASAAPRRCRSWKMRDERDRREDRRAHHRQQRPVGELVEGGVDRDRDEIAGHEPPAGGSRSRRPPRGSRARRARARSPRGSRASCRA